MYWKSLLSYANALFPVLVSVIMSVTVYLCNVGHKADTCTIWTEYAVL